MMIVSCVVDPACFAPDAINDELSRREAIALLKAIRDNGVLLDIAQRSLLGLSLDNAGRLGTKQGQDLSLRLIELRKDQKRYCASFGDIPPGRVINSAETIAALAQSGKADAIFTTDSRRQAIIDSGEVRCPVFLFRDYSQTGFEELRVRLRDNAQPLDTLSLAQRDDLLGRTVRYTPTLRIYDYRMVATIGRCPKFLAGIQHLVSIWDATCLVCTSFERRLEIITVGNTQTRTGYLTADKAAALLDEQILRPIGAKFAGQVVGIVKNDGDPGIFHARGYEARRRVFTIDPGFDALGKSGSLRRCLLQLGDFATLQHFAECRQLPDVKL